MLNVTHLKKLLDEKYEAYNQASFIQNDPICIPHRFKTKEDIEISAFLTASIAWGNRKSIINNADRMMDSLDNTPYDFIVNHKETDLKSIQGFVHRTFNNGDFLTFIQCLQNLYLNHDGLEGAFSASSDMFTNLSHFPNIFFELEVPSRTRKHVSRVDNGSAAKRINMFLRWMVRNDSKGVDFGIWTKVKPSSLYMPLDVHSGNVARHLGLLNRKQNDWKAVVELTETLRDFDPEDPVKYDYALFGMGVFEKLI